MAQTLATTVDLLIGQWLASPRLRAHPQIFIDIINQEICPALDKLQEQLSIDTAVGVWLDYIGVRMGLPRPATSDPAQDVRFGFAGPTQARGFDLAPFKGDAVNDAVYPLPDAVYRKFIKSRAILVLSDGTAQTFGKAVREIDPGANVQDQRNMVIRVVTDAVQRPFLELADLVGALPRSAGVLIEYASRGTFGMSDDPDSDEQSGVGFDSGAIQGLSVADTRGKKNTRQSLGV